MATTSIRMACSICDVATVLPQKRLYGYSVCTKCHSDFAMKRALAYLVDTTLWSIVSVPLGIFFLVLSVGSGIMTQAATKSEDSASIMFLIVLVLGGLVGVVGALSLDGFKGHSPAKAMFGLQVIDDLTGRPINFWDSIRRNLPILIPFMTLFIGYQVFQSDGRRMGDGWARTKVIWKTYRDKAPFLSRRQLQVQLAARSSGTTGRN